MLNEKMDAPLTTWYCDFCGQPIIKENEYVGKMRPYRTSDDKPTRAEKIKHWIDYFKDGNNA